MLKFAFSTVLCDRASHIVKHSRISQWSCTTIRCFSDSPAIQTGSEGTLCILTLSLHLLTRTNHNVDDLAGYDAWEGRQHLINCVLAKSGPYSKEVFEGSASSGSLIQLLLYSFSLQRLFLQLPLERLQTKRIPKISPNSLALWTTTCTLMSWDLVGNLLLIRITA